VRAQLGRRDDAVDRADLHRALDAVDPVELRGQLSELLGADLGVDRLVAVAVHA
jgi:hypothetical protein